MDRYQTFFLCGTHWNRPERFIHFAHWALTELKPQFVAGFDDGPVCVLSATKRDDFGKRKPSFSGDYFDLHDALMSEDLESFFIIAGLRQQMYMKVELLHLKPAINATGVLGQANTDVPNGIKIVSMSLRKDTWHRCQQLGSTGEIIRRWEQLFIDSGALYGYVATTYFPTTGRSAQVNLAVEPLSSYYDGGSLPQMRVADFDYTRFVETLYPLNYISTMQLNNSGARNRLLAASGDVRSRLLRDSEGNEVGIALELTNDSEISEQRCIEILGNLLWRPADSD